MIFISDKVTYKNHLRQNQMDASSPCRTSFGNGQAACRGVQGARSPIASYFLKCGKATYKKTLKKIK